MCNTTLTQPAQETFADRLLGILNGGALSLMVSIGHRTQLFDTLAALPPVTSEGLAAAAGLDERYVREWLGAMVAGGIVAYDAGTRRYALPAEHAQVLTRAAAADNMAPFAQYIGLLGSVEDRVVACFERGGGVPYSAYPRFQEVMAEDSGQSVVAALLDHILPLVPGLAQRLEAGIDVLDVGCGSGRALLLLGRTFPRSRFTGYDLSEEGVARANRVAREEGLSNVTFALRDVTDLGATAAFDLVTAFDAIHDQARPARVLAEIARALRHDGVFLMQDIHASSHVHENREHPIGPFLYTISCMHCMTVSLAEGGAGLGAMWGRELALEMLAEAGFLTTGVHELPHDVQNCYYVSTVA